MNQVLHYNVHSVGDIIRQGHEFKIEPYLSRNYSKALFNKYDSYRLNKNAVYDRTGAIPHYLNMSPVHPMPVYDPTFTKSFNEIAEERARALIALDKPIKVCWSGGIDSTYALFLLRHFAKDKAQVTAFGTYISVIESGDVFDKHIKNNMLHDIRVSPNPFTKNPDTEEIWVTGFQGNQLFGPTDNFFASNTPVSLFHHTLGTKETIYEPYEKHISADILEFLQPAIDRSPRKLETVNDIRWYCIFNLDWYNGLYDIKSEMHDFRMDNVHHFFDTIDFQKWAITTKEPFTKIKGNPNTHRWQMRDRLADFGLVDYAKNKSKTISTFASMTTSWLMLLGNKQNIYLK
jgi:hypothetical protein